MAEAKKRNPSIKLFTLAWTAPGWIGDGTRGPESEGGYYSQDNIDYHLKWIKGLKSAHNLTLDYMGCRTLCPSENFSLNFLLVFFWMWRAELACWILRL